MKNHLKGASYIFNIPIVDKFADQRVGIDSELVFADELGGAILLFA